MITAVEIRSRVDFYSGVLGESRIQSSALPCKLWPVANYSNMVQALVERGFNDPQKVINTWPIILNISHDVIDEKIQGLRDRGFSNPQRLITASPAILGLTFENIDRKIAGFTERGFTDPIRLIISLPAVLGYSLGNIDKKMKLCRRLNVNIEDFIDCTVVFAGMSSKHYIPLLRRCRTLGLEPTPRKIFNLYVSKNF